MKPRLIVILLAWCTLNALAGREKLNFNADWLMQVGDWAEAMQPSYDDARWQQVTLPRAFNGHEAFGRDIVDLTDTVCWYRKHFILSEEQLRGKVFVEFEGVRQGADFYLNGHHLGFSENGVMACGFDLTPFARVGENVMAVRCDNNWQYRDRRLDSRFQWNDRNFNANYGGIPKNVFLHLTDKLYQTLPLYSVLGTTGTYIYATDFDIPTHKAVIHAESQVKNEDSHAHTFSLNVCMKTADGKVVARFKGEPLTLAPGASTVAKAQAEVGGLHFWSWGYGYLYTVETSLDEGSVSCDIVATRTGFRKTRFAEGKFWLNDRVMMIHGYAQRTSNEWPGTGVSVPAWLSDYSNALMVESGANLVRWMHVTPWKQDVESCDRVGLMQAMPAGDSEKDVEGARWQQRTELMRDAIIYNRNNPSIIFYEGGNESISREHMLELKAIRDTYDPHGGRAIGSREMLDIDEAEYGGEMLYINKSGKHPMWAMEYCRDEGLRKYWDEQSYPYHKHGDGPLYRGQPAIAYNQNMDWFARQMVERWYEYWLERPGTGRRVSSGGVKIVFSDTNTHHRGESNFRMSGVTDAMRLPKDAFFAHQVMWDGWVEPEHDRTHIIGHWNYEPGTVKDIYVVSTGDKVDLLVNNKSVGSGERSFKWLYRFKDVKFEPGTLEAVSYTEVGEGDSHDMSLTSRDTLFTAGEPDRLRLTTIGNPEGMKADGADMVLLQVEVVDKQGRRCPLDDRMVNFQLWGEGQWIGGIGTRNNKQFQLDDPQRDKTLLDAANKKNTSDNYVGHMSLPLECGVCRVLVRSTPTAGDIGVGVQTQGLRPVYFNIKTESVDVAHYLPQMSLPCRLDRGETPLTPSYTDVKRSIDIIAVKAGSNLATAAQSYDDNELSEWKSDGKKENAWVTYKLARKAKVDELTLKLTGWRNKCYPLEVYAGKKLVWQGITDATLGYCHLRINRPVAANDITVRMVAPVQDSSKYGDTKELAGGNAGEFDRLKAEPGKVELRLVEIDILESVNPKNK
ncbi:MAG: DUF4982 domain-containing protein [Prevotella sp.]|nr:DUF4982 domain-containing protein [Prevotella sp.]